MSTPISPQQATYTVHGKLVKETPKAMLITVLAVEGDELEEPKNEWFPKSQIVAHSLAEFPTDPDCFSCKRWIVEGKSLLPGQFKVAKEKTK